MRNTVALIEHDQPHRSQTECNNYHLQNLCFDPYLKAF